MCIRDRLEGPVIQGDRTDRRADDKKEERTEQIQVRRSQLAIFNGVVYNEEYKKRNRRKCMIRVLVADCLLYTSCR